MQNYEGDYWFQIIDIQYQAVYMYVWQSYNILFPHSNVTYQNEP